MAGYGTTFMKALNDLVFKGTAFTSPSGVMYLSLHTADPGIDGQTSNEVSGGSYARKVTAATDWNAGTNADPSVTTNATTLTFATATASWGTVTHFGLWRTLSGTATTDFIGRGALTASQTINNTNTASFAASAISHSFDSV
jgi:hypothetical protein